VNDPAVPRGIEVLEWRHRIQHDPEPPGLFPVQPGGHQLPGHRGERPRAHPGRQPGGKPRRGFWRGAHVL